MKVIFIFRNYPIFIFSQGLLLTVNLGFKDKAGNSQNSRSHHQQTNHKYDEHLILFFIRIAVVIPDNTPQQKDANHHQIDYLSGIMNSITVRQSLYKPNGEG